MRKGTFIVRIAAVGMACGLFTTLFGAPFTDLANGTVRDELTKLYWQKCSVGQGTAGAQYTDCAVGSATSQTWQVALNTCNSLSLAGRVWRLPSLNELRSIVDDSQSNPAVDAAAFPNTATGAYVSATTKASSANTQRVIFFSSGSSGQMLKTGSTSVRCVSGP